MRITLIALIALAASSPPRARAAIFGYDSRRAITRLSPFYELGRATAISVLASTEVKRDDGSVDLDVDVLHNFCADENLAGETSSDYACTGFLVAPDLLATAGHCVYAVNTPRHQHRHETGLSCEVFDWLFDFNADESGYVQTTRIPAERFFHCREIIFAAQSETFPFEDYALIRLDRPALGRAPLSISPTGPKAGEKLSMIGHPYGTATKLSDDARVLLDDPLRSQFVANLDAFEGNSGGPVFNSRREVVGILVSGAPIANVYRDQVRQCDRFNRCDDNGEHCAEPDAIVLPGFQRTGSDVQRMAPILDVMAGRLPPE